jgi:cation:H+ antiporter
MESRNKAEGLHIRGVLGLKSNRTAILLQLILSLIAIFVGAEIFITKISTIAKIIGVSALVLSLVIAPIATELPEKFNSIIWIRKGKDSLALGNITGAMVFQSCIPVTIGIVATSWQVDYRVIVSSVLVILSALTNIVWIGVKGRLNIIPLMFGGIYYILFILALYCN